MDLPLYSPLSIDTYCHFEPDLRRLDEIAAAMLHVSEHGLIPSGVKHPVSPIAAILIENARHGVNVNLQRFPQPFDPVLRYPDLDRHERLARKRAEFFPQIVRDLLAIQQQCRRLRVNGALHELLRYILDEDLPLAEWRQNDAQQLPDRREVFAQTGGGREQLKKLAGCARPD